MNNTEFKSKVMKCLMSKIEDLTNSNYSKINKNKTKHKNAFQQV